MLSGLEKPIAEAGTKLIIERVVPTITEYGKMLWSGKKFLIIGPPRCGKTNFLRFLEYLVLEPEKITAPTLQVSKGDDRTLRLGPDGNLILRLRKPRDTPGQMPLHQIQYIEQFTPHCLVILLDATRFWGVPDSESSLEWLEQFCSLLDPLLRKDGKITRRLRSMIVVMNKWDKITAKDEEDDQVNRELFTSYVRATLDKCLHNSFYTPGGATVIEVIPCSLVRSKLGDGLARELVQSIALTLSR